MMFSKTVSPTASSLTAFTTDPEIVTPDSGAERSYPMYKASLDFLGAIVLGAIFLPVMAVVAVLVRLTSKGPAFYTQTRVGRGNVRFTIYKFRTMTHDCEAKTGPRWSSGDSDPRVTRFGHFLRKMHLDELPQLLNVLKGDMSLVGPRPERPEFVASLERTVPHYAERLTVRPGVTGLAQIHLPPDLDVESVRRKLIYDRYYIRNANFWMDLRLVVCTAIKMLQLPLPLACRVLGVPNRDKVEGTETDAATGSVLCEPQPS